MNSIFSKFLRNGLNVCLGLVLMTAANADTFLPPTGKLSPFRRDRLPINEREIGMLSYRLTTIACATPYETAEDRRAVAKALALAIALKPKNESATGMLDKLIQGEKPDFTDKDRVDIERKRIWDSMQWLSTPEAGQDGNVLAALLGETLANIFPSNPQLSSYLGKPEHAAWDGWVPELALYKKAPVTQPEPKPEDKEDQEDKEKKPEDKEELATNTPKEERKYDPKTGLVLESAKLSTVLRMYDKDKSLWLHKVVPLQMNSNKDPKNEDGEDQYGFQVQISGDSDDYWQMHEELSGPLREHLSKSLGQLPERGRVRVRLDTESPYPFRKNRGAITGPAFVLAHAALTGATTDGIVVGEIDRSGKLKLPAYFWRALTVLAEGSGGRLIIPASAEPMLINLLALEKPDFFFKYEVLVASSLDELVTLSSKESSAQHEEIYNKFKLIKEKSANNPIGGYLTNKFVRERLQEIVDQAPYHLSAKILLIYGSVSRPRYLTREALAAEIWSKIDVVSEIAKIEDFYGINSNQLKRLNDLYEQMREDLKNLERYTDSRNTDLLRDAKEVVTSVRGFGREFEGKGEMWEKIDKIENAHDAMKEGNEKLLEKLKELTGD